MITLVPRFSLIKGYLFLLIATFSTSFLYANEKEPSSASTVESAGHTILLSKSQDGNYQQDDPESCPDCFSSEIISQTKTESGCTVYTLEVMNDGNCRHALSHYSVEIPCGKVKNISNSENWKVEIGKDPTTGINGFKIDDIEGFGEKGQSGSFKVEFTVCPDDQCVNIDCWDAQVAHKAGLCVTTESLSFCQPTEDPVAGHQETTDCLAQAADGGGHSVWIDNYLNGKDGKFFFEQGSGGVEQFGDGTGRITGTIYLPEHPDDKWELDVWISDGKNWNEWEATGGSYKGNKDIVGDLYKTWSYYIIDPSKDNQLIGKGKNAGESLPVYHYPAGYEYGVQIGLAANDKNGNQGLSVWWTSERNGKLLRGDFNFDLSCDEVDTPPDCDVNELAANFTTTDVSCEGASDGSIDLEVIGGVAPFTFIWSNGATTQDISALGGGNYSVTITDANDATLQLSGTIFEPSQLSAIGTVSPASCDTANGSIALAVSGGTAPYVYSWTNNSSERDLAGLSAGDYSVTITDANGCSITENFTLLATSNIAASITTNDCNDGSLVLNLEGGAPPYTYEWSTGESTKDIKVSTEGSYNVIVTDVNGCSAEASIDIGPISQFNLSIEPITPSCGGAGDGGIILNVDGGVGPFTYSWSNGPGTAEIATTKDLSNVPSAFYQVVVTDSRGCTQELKDFLRDPASIFINNEVTPIRCDGNGADGAIDITIWNAAEPYTVAWTKASSTGVFETAEDLSGLAADVYTITVTDANGCQGVKSFELSAPEDFQVDLAQQYCGDGRLCPTLSGGSGPFTYVWTNQAGNTIPTIDGCIDVTEAGTYTVQVIDDNGCTKSASYTIGAPNPSLSTSLDFTELTCAGSNNASASVSITGGEAPYDITWSTGEKTESISDLGAGTYTVKVEDVNGCRQFRAFSIQEPQSIEVTASAITQVSCNGESDGTIDLTVANGIAPYTYQWSNGATSEDLAGLGAGTYSVTVSDASGCSVMSSFDVNVNPDNTNCDSGNGDGGNNGGDGGDSGNGNGDGDGTNDPCIRDCNTCDGNVTMLTLKYLGEEPNANIVVKQKNGEQVVYNAVVAPEGEFNLVGTDFKGTLTSGIIITVNGGEQTIIHTDCSQPIGPGLIAGAFEVVDGESRNGGALCPVEPGTKQEEETNEEPEVVEPSGEDCGTCHESNLLSITETEDGCITYRIEVSNNGACTNALSHYSVRVPCGIVTQASNSGGWAMELNGKDKHNSLYGLKVDDINGFGEDGQEGTFTLTYTVCPNKDDECIQNLKSEDIIVGYKAGQCAKIETIKFNDQVTNFDPAAENVAPLTFIKFNVYPNPVSTTTTSDLKIKFEEANIGEQLNVKVVSPTGKSILTKRMEITRANEILPLGLAGTKPGVYFVTITSHHKVYSEKIIIK